jgi:quercetin dioxygenase-like cupin family protein
MDKTSNSKALRAYCLKPGEGVMGLDSSLKASGLSTGGNFTVIESRTDGGAPWHVHTREDEYFYVLEGTLLVQCGDETFEAGPRSFVFLPRNVPHQWDVIGDEATLLMMTIPAGLDTFLHEFHAAGSMEERNQIAANYGITFLPKPEKTS